MLCCCAFESQSSPLGSPYVRNFSRSDYKAGTQNWSIGKDHRGMMYFGNNKGLLEFDGTIWKTYNLPNHTIVRSFAFGDSAMIFVGGQNEIGFLKAEPNGELSYHSLSALIPKDAAGYEDIWKIFDLDGKVYFCSEKAILIYENNAIELVKPIKDRFENFFNVNNTILVQDMELGLFKLQNNELVKIPNSEIFLGNRIVSIISQGNNSLFVTRSGNLYLQESTFFKEWAPSSSKFLLKNKPYCAIKLKDNRLAIGTSQNGLLVMEENGDAYIHLNSTNGLQNNTVLSISEDDHSNLWLGLDNGIDYVEVNSSFTLIDDVLGVSGTGYCAIMHDNSLYLGTNQGLYKMDWGQIRNPLDDYKFEIVPDAIGQVWSLTVIDNDLIVGEHSGLYYAKNDVLKKFSDFQGAWKFVQLKSNDQFAIEGTYSGLVVYKKQNKKDGSFNWRIHERITDFNESFRVFEEDVDGKIWISHAYKGLYRITLSEDMKSISKTEYFNVDNGLPANLFINVARIRNEIIFTTTNGIYKFDKIKNRFVIHEDFDKIFGKNRNFNRIQEDQLGNIWFSVDNEFGVLRVTQKGVFNDLEVLYFNQIQEDLVDGFEHIYAIDNENILIGTERGFVHYNPIKNNNVTINFDVYIRKITSITDGDSVLSWGKPDISARLSPVDFQYDHNDFRFDYSSPYYDKIDFVTYRYKLDGFENTWSDWSPKTQKEYTNLKEGIYTFKVEARNAYGNISNADSFTFEIHPPWYLNFYFKVAYFILAIILFSLLIRFIYYREEKKRNKLKEEQILKLQSKDEEFKKEVEKSESQIIKLRNDQLRADISHRNSQLASSTMHLVQKSEILMKLKGDLSQLSKEAPPELRRRIVQISRKIDEDIQLDDNWDQFELYFDQVHENFFKRLREKFPELTPKDHKLCAYLRMNLNTKEIAPLLNISVRGVEISRYRMRKKLNLDSNDNLVAVIMDI